MMKKFFLIGWFIGLLGMCVFWAVIAYIACHFIAKLW